MKTLFDKLKGRPELTPVSLHTMKKCFQSLDPENLGYIPLHVLKEKLMENNSHMPDPLTEEEIKKMFDFCSSKEQKRFYYNDYCLDANDFISSHLKNLHEKHSQ